uniref:JmjC domain-containing protein n=1 Tax=Panagrolaimus superbus TaxID=310955 RepID=A0A914Y4L9_9BILA
MPARPFEMIDNDFTFMEEANNETLGIPIFKLIQSGPLKFLTTAVTEYLVFETTIVAKENLHGIYSFKKTQLATKNFLIQPIFENINNVISDLPILIKHSEADFQNATSIKVAVLDLNKNSDFESPLTPFCEQFKTTLKLHHLDTPGVTSVKVQIIDGKGIWSTAQIGPFAYPEIYYLRPNSAPQTWLIVKSGDVKRLLKLLPKTSPFDCSNVFCHSNVSITKEWLESVGIKYVVIKHRPGEYVVVKAGTLYQIASCGIAIMDKCSVYLNRCILESRLSYLCCCVDMHAHFDAGTWCSLKTLRDKEEVELVKAFQGSFRKRLPNKSILRPLNDDVQPKHSNQMTPDVARQYVQMVSSNISSAQLDIIPAVETPESQKVCNNSE